MRKLLFTLAVALLAFGLAAGQEADKIGGRELALSLGDALGDFHSSFSWGLCYNFPIDGRLRAELEMFYYFGPTEVSQTPGLAITSTGVTLGINCLFRWPLAGPRLILEAGAAWGRIAVSETWRYSTPKHKISKGSEDMYWGPAAGLQIRLDGQSGVRFDFRYFTVPSDGRLVPRLSMGYTLWF